MVVFHVMRCARYVLRGFLEPKKGIFDETLVNVYAGLRMADAFGHVNNAKFLEIFEFGRWHQGGAQRIFAEFRKARVLPFVAASHVQYLLPISPATLVTVRTRVVNTDGRWWVMRQLITDRSGRKVYAAALFRIAIMDRSPEGEPGPQPPGAAEGRATKKASTISGEEACRRLGFDPNTVRELLAKAWEMDINGSVAKGGPRAEDSLLAAEVLARSRALIDEANDFDEKWRGLLRYASRRK